MNCCKKCNYNLDIDNIKHKVHKRPMGHIDHLRNNSKQYTRLCQAIIKPARGLKEKGKVFKSRGSFFVQLFPLGKGEILYLIILLKLGQWFYREAFFFTAGSNFSSFVTSRKLTPGSFYYKILKIFYRGVGWGWGWVIFRCIKINLRGSLFVLTPSFR